MIFFKKKEQKYTEPSEIIAYNKIKKVISGCKTIRQLVFAKSWMMSVYNTYDWNDDIYFHHLYVLYETKLIKLWKRNHY